MLSKILKTPIYDIVKQTSLDHAPILSQLYNNNIFFKREDQQLVKSFKIRGAHQMISSLSQSQLSSGLIAASAGNHAQGVALSASHLNVKSTIIMPTVTPSIKWKSVQNLGADVILKGDTFDDAYSYALELAKENNYTFIHPFDNEDIIAGQGTIAMELSKQWNFRDNNLDAIFVPIGGGGLISGIGYYMKNLYPDTKIIGVEPLNANAMYQSLKADKLVKLNEIDTFAEGVAVKNVGKYTFSYCKKYVDEIVQCNTDEICESIQLVFEETRVIMEPAGALSLAGIIKYIVNNSSKNLNFISILSGANMNFTRLRYIAERSIKNELLIGIEIPEIPGSLKKICTLLDSPNITEFNYRYTDNDNAYIFVGIQTNNKDIIINKLRKHCYKIIDLSNNEIAKTHIRYQIGGGLQSNSNINELLYQFEFPEKQDSLLNFLEQLSEISNNNWNITLFNYRNTGSSIAYVLCGLNVPKEDHIIFNLFLDKLGYTYSDETNNSAYKLFC